MRYTRVAIAQIPDWSMFPEVPRSLASDLPGAKAYPTYWKLIKEYEKARDEFRNSSSERLAKNSYKNYFPGFALGLMV